MSLEISPKTTRIGWIGTGVMGASMCGHLIAAGYHATVYSRTRDKSRSLIDRGARWAESPREVAESSDVVFSIVGFPRDVREVILGSRGALAGARTGSFLVDMTTSEPALALEIDRAASAKGVASVDAPVSGGDVGAREARLSIMVGGRPEHVQTLMPLLQLMGKTIVHQGPAAPASTRKWSIKS